MFNLLAKFDLRDNWTPPTNILQERYIVSAAWMELGESEVHAVSVLDNPKLYKKDPHNDRHVVETLHRELSTADLIIAHNGDKFDLRWLNGRILFHGLPPLPPMQTLDTYKVAKRVFELNSYRLDYLGQYLKVGGKATTPKGLWLDVLRGDIEAIKTMVQYNKRDVELLKEVYLKVRGFAPSHFNSQLITDEGDHCPRCQSLRIQSRGERTTLTQVYRRFQCLDCGGWFRARAAIKNRATTHRVG